MAIMIPTEPYEYTKESHEGEIFNYFRKNLPSDYYVFHSVTLDYFDEENNESYMHEMDFLVFHPALGLLCIESKHGKTGKVYVSERKCYSVKEQEPGTGKYLKGKEFPHGGPFRQANDRMRDLIKYIKNQSIYLSKNSKEKLADHCKVTFAVCFPGISSAGETITMCNKKGKAKDPVKFEDMLKGPETPKQRIIYGNDLKSADLLKAKVDGILSYGNESGIETGYDIGQENKREPLTEEDVQNLFDLVLCPNYNIVETLDPNNHETKYIRLNEDQISVLELLQKKREMAVSGMAGTGKTILALQLARKKVMQGEHVLFLCRSSYQKQELRKNKLNSKIDFRDIDWLNALYNNCSNTDLDNNFYKKLSDVIRNEKIEMGELKSNNNNQYPPYAVQTIIVDEAQDFCKGKTYDNLNAFYKSKSSSNTKEASLKQKIEERIADIKYSFYIFYDEFQTENESKVLEFAQNFKNHVELNKNCRNTINIAKTGLKPMVNVNSDYCQRTDKGERVKIDFYKDEESLRQHLDSILQKFKLNPDETVILTLEKEDLKENQDKDNPLTRFRKRYVGCSDKYKLDNKEFLFTSWEQFKGLEKRNIVLLGLDPEKLKTQQNEDYCKRIYVAVTRAQEKVFILSRLTDNKGSIEEELNANQEKVLDDIYFLSEPFGDEGEILFGGLSRDEVDRLAQLAFDDTRLKEIGKKLNGRESLEREKREFSVNEGFLKDIYYAWKERKEFERQLELRKRLNPDVKDILDSSGHSRKEFCKAFYAENIYGFDIIVQKVFRCFSKIGNKVGSLKTVNNKEQVIIQFHVAFCALIGVWEGIIKSVFSNCKENSNMFELEDKYLQADDYAQEWGLYQWYEELQSCSDKGINLKVLWAGYQLWSKCCQEMITKQTCNMNDLMEAKRIMPDFLRNLKILMFKVSFCFSWPWIDKNGSDLSFYTFYEEEPDISILQEDNSRREELDKLMGRAFLYYFINHLHVIGLGYDEVDFRDEFVDPYFYQKNIDFVEIYKNNQDCE